MTVPNQAIARAALLAPGRERDRDRRRGHQHQHAGRVGAGLGVDVGSKEHRHHEADEREDEHQRPGRARPVGRHAVARQVAGHDVEQARPSPRRRRTRESESSRCRRRCRSRRRDTRGPDRPGRGHSPRPPSSNASCGISRVVTKLLAMSSTLMISAAVVSSLPGVADAARRVPRVSVGSPLTSGITDHAGLEAGQPERQLREEEAAATPTISDRTAVLERRARPASCRASVGIAARSRRRARRRR